MWKIKLICRTITFLVIGFSPLYSQDYPENGTKLNGGWHLGGGFEYSLEKNTKLFAPIRWFHTSNNDVYGRERNPSVNALGIAIGIQL